MTLLLGFGAGVRITAEGRRSWSQTRIDVPTPDQPDWGWSDDIGILMPLRSRFAGVSIGTGGADVMRGLRRLGADYPGWSGASVPFIQVGRITGTTLDADGAALGSVKLLAFRTTDDVVVNPPGEFQSNTDGTYHVGVGSGNHYLVAYKAGAPDVAGTTVDTLTGT